MENLQMQYDKHVFDLYHINMSTSLINVYSVFILRHKLLVVS